MKNFLKNNEMKTVSENKIIEFDIISSSMKKQRERIKSLLSEAMEIAEIMGDNVEQVKIFEQKLENIISPIMFVVAGEVKAGKSSFINAFLNEDICAVDASPCTSTVQEITYGKTHGKKRIDDFQERISIPSGPLKHITIVDTPGTNSIIERHQVITENYIPKSDAAVFVFSAKNPYTATGWKLFSLIHDKWRRKIVFVLQQKDIATKEELAAARTFIQEKAREYGIDSAVIFEVSAKLEKNGEHEKSGFNEFRNFMKKQVKTGEVWRIKVESACETIRRICADFISDLDLQKEELKARIDSLEDIQRQSEVLKENANNVKNKIIERFVSVHSELSNEIVDELKNGLRARKLIRRSIPLLRDKKVKAWFGDLMARYEKIIAERFEKVAENCAEDLAREVENSKIEINRYLVEKGIKNAGGVRDAEQKNRTPRMDDDMENWKLDEFAASSFKGYGKFSSRIFSGGVTTTAGTVIAALGNTAFLDYTGISLAVVGIGYITYYAAVKSRKILKDVTAQFNAEREKFEKRIDMELSSFLDMNFSRLEEPIKKEIFRKKAELAAIRQRRDKIADLASRAADELKR